MPQLVRWEYATVVYENQAAHNSSTSSWTWTTTATLRMRAKIVARWSVTYPPATMPAISTQYSWTPVGNSPPEHNRVVQGPIDHLGDLGWELVTVKIDSGAIRTGSEIGWHTSISVIATETYLFKRPVT